MAEAKKTAQEFSTYKGRPLVRCGDEIYYGNMSEPYVIRLQVKSKNEVNGLQVADKVTVQLLATDPDLSPRKKLVKSSEKHGLFVATRAPRSISSRAICRRRRGRCWWMAWISSKTRASASG